MKSYNFLLALDYDAATEIASNPGPSYFWPSFFPSRWPVEEATTCTETVLLPEARVGGHGYSSMLVCLFVTRGAWAATGIVVCWSVCLFVTRGARGRPRV